MGPVEPLCTSMKEEAWARSHHLCFLGGARNDGGGAAQTWGQIAAEMDLAHLGPCLPWRGSGPSLSHPSLTSARVSSRSLGEPKQNRKLVAEVSPAEPAHRALSGCTFTVEGVGPDRGQKTVDVSAHPSPRAGSRGGLWLRDGYPWTPSPGL